MARGLASACDTAGVGLYGEDRLRSIEHQPPALRWWQAVPIRTFVWAMLHTRLAQHGLQPTQSDENRREGEGAQQ